MDAAINKSPELFANSGVLCNIPVKTFPCELKKTIPLPIMLC